MAAVNAPKEIQLDHLAIAGVDLDLLEAQRLILNDMLWVVNDIPAVTMTDNQREALAGVCNMLDAWSDIRHHQQAEDQHIVDAAETKAPDYVHTAQPDDPQPMLHTEGEQTFGQVPLDETVPTHPVREAPDDMPDIFTEEDLP